MSDGYGKTFFRKSFLTLGGGAPAYAHTYEWTSGGYGSRYANPAVLPTTATSGMGGDFNSPDNNALVQVFLVSAGGSGIQGYNWSDSGYGTKYTNPSETISWESIHFNPADKTRFVTSTGSANFIAMYQFSSTSGFGTRYTTATISSLAAYSARYNTSGNTVFVTGGLATGIAAWPATTTGFGTRYANPATLPGGTCFAAEASPDNSVVLVYGGLNASGAPRIHAYAWTTASGFGTKYANPAVLGTSSTTVCSWSPSGTVAFTGINVNPGIRGYNWNNSTGFGTVLTSPAGTASGLTAARFNREGNAIVTAASNSPFTHAWAWSGSAFGSKFANPATLPDSNTRRSPGLSRY
jgi:hypothetical protein